MKVKSIIKYCIIIIFLFIVFYLKYTGFSPKSEEILIWKGKSDVYPEFNKEITCITWDIRYGIFGEKSDFYKEGGKTEGSGRLRTFGAETVRRDGAASGDVWVDRVYRGETAAIVANRLSFFLI